MDRQAGDDRSTEPYCRTERMTADDELLGSFHRVQRDDLKNEDRRHECDDAAR